MQIRTSNISTVVQLSREIPELEKPYLASEYKKRLTEVPHVILAAFVETQVVGFKVGYEREGYFYSWMGGVHPDFRRKGIALALAEAQEEWARKHHYSSVTFKTRNRLKAMLCFALQRGFHIFQVDPYPDVGESRIWLKKEL